jgi:hypothetical protein
MNVPERIGPNTIIDRHVFGVDLGICFDLVVCFGGN